MSILQRFVSWMETGDLVPALIGVSVPHYAQVLAQYDFWVVAAIIGFLVDIGHFRTIKLALRGGGWFWMIVLTAFSFGVHMAFYALGGAGLWAILLGAMVPAVIFSLAYITKRERLDKKPANETQDIAQGANKVTRDAFLTLWRANGHKSVASLANELGVNTRTAQKWVKSDATEGNRA